MAESARAAPGLDAIDQAPMKTTNEYTGRTEAAGEGDQREHKAELVAIGEEAPIADRGTGEIADRPYTGGRLASDARRAKDRASSTPRSGTVRRSDRERVDELLLEGLRSGEPRPQADWTSLSRQTQTGR